MIKYASGIEAMVGDRVDYDGVPSVVEEVIDTPDKVAAWGLEGPGLLFKNDVFGRVFEPCDSVSWEATIFIQRGA